MLISFYFGPSTFIDFTDRWVSKFSFKTKKNKGLATYYEDIGQYTNYTMYNK